MVIGVIYRKNPKTYACDLGDSLVLFNCEREEYFRLKDASRFIWNLLEIPRTVDAIILEILDHYEVSYDVCRQSVEIFLKKLRNEELLIDE